MALSVGGEIGLAGVTSQGCTPIGETWTLTRVEQNIIHEIANRPAYEVLAETFSGLTPEEQRQARGNLFIGLVVNEYLEEFHRGDFLIRNLLGADPRSGSIAIGALARAGQTVQFQRRSAAAATEDMKALLTGVAERLRGHLIYGGSLCCCNGRGRGLFEEPPHDASLVPRPLGPLGLAAFLQSGNRAGGRAKLPAWLHGLAGPVLSQIAMPPRPSGLTRGRKQARPPFRNVHEIIFLFGRMKCWQTARRAGWGENEPLDVGLGTTLKAERRTLKPKARRLSAPFARAWGRWLALFLLLTGSVRAQEAVRLSLASAEAAEARRRAAATLGYYNLKLGPTAWRLGASLGTEWSDNIRLEGQNPKSDFLFRPEMTARMLWPISDKNSINLSWAPVTPRTPAIPNTTAFTSGPGPNSRLIFCGGLLEHRARPVFHPRGQLPRPDGGRLR